MSAHYFGSTFLNFLKRIKVPHLATSLTNDKAIAPALSHITPLYHIVSYCPTIPHYLMLSYYTALSHIAPLYHIVSCCPTIPHCLILPHYTTLSHIAPLYHIVSYCPTIPYCFILSYYITLFHIAPLFHIVSYCPTLSHIAPLCHIISYCPIIPHCGPITSLLPVLSCPYLRLVYVSDFFPISQPTQCCALRISYINTHARLIFGTNALEKIGTGPYLTNGWP